MHLHQNLIDLGKLTGMEVIAQQQISLRQFRQAQVLRKPGETYTTSTEFELGFA